MNNATRFSLFIVFLISFLNTEIAWSQTWNSSWSIGIMKEGVPFTGNVTAASTTGYQVLSGALPPGLSLNTSTGAITGTPTTAGDYFFEIRANGTTPITRRFYRTVAPSKPYELYVWGDNTYGQIGNGTASVNDQLFPTRVVSQINWASISVGSDHLAGISEDGKLYTWGRNRFGALGDNTTANKAVPTQICVGGNCATDQIRWAMVHAGDEYTIAITTTGLMYSWGYNEFGHLGIGTFTNALAPVLVSPPLGDLWTYVSGGVNHAIAITASGKLYGWGNASEYGAVGDGTTIDFSLPTASIIKRPSPVQIGSSLNRNWSFVAAGGLHSMALTAAGELFTWGGNFDGQLGLNNKTDFSTPQKVGTATNWVRLAGGYGHSVAINSSGQIFTWGANFSGQLADGTTVGKLVPTRVAATINGVATTWKSIFAGWYADHGMFISNSGILYGVGNNNDGVLGDGFNSTNQYLVNNVLRDFRTELLPVNDFLWQKVAANYGNTAAFGTDPLVWTTVDIGLMKVGTPFVGSVVATTTNGSTPTYSISSGQLPDGLTLSSSTGQITGTPTITSEYFFEVKVTAGSLSKTLRFFRIVAPSLRTDLYVWGNNTSGQIGDGTTTRKLLPTRVGSTTSWSFVATGYDHTMGLTEDGKIYTWGSNSDGQLGDGTTVSKNTPVQICPGGNCNTQWTYVAAGFRYSIAISTEGRMYAWGANSSGQLGIGTTTATSTPTEIPRPAGDFWMYVSGGQLHNLALTASGKMYAWGEGADGKLGDGQTITNQSKPVQIASGLNKNWTYVGTGNSHSLAITQGGELYVWGNNTGGQLGLGNTTAYSSPQRLGTATDWIEVTGGYAHSIALKSTGEIWAWGANTNGQLGDGTTTNRLSPVRVANLPGITWLKLFRGSYADHSLFLTNTNNIYNVGANSVGQLGDGTTSSRSAVQQVGNNFRWYRIAANYEHSAALGTEILTLDKYELTLDVTARNEQITATVASIILDPTVTWTVSEPGIIDFRPFGQDTKNVFIDALATGVVKLKASVLGGYFAEAIIYVTGPPSWTETALNCAEPGVAYSDGVKANGVPLPAYSVVSGSLPTGLSLNTSTGAITGTTTTPGSYNFTIRATNTLGTVDQALTLNVFGWTSENVGIIKKGASFNGSVTAAGSNVVYSVSAGALPPGISLGASTGILSGQATETGSYRFTISATDCGKTISKKFIRVVYPNIDFDLYTWGKNGAGELGNGTTSPKIYPTQVTNPTGLGWVMTANGSRFSLAITDEGQLYSWGENSYGKLGLGSNYSSIGSVNTPTRVCIGNCSDPQPVWVWISAGSDYSLGLTLDGKLYTWGRDNRGQLGDGGSNADKNTPTLIPAPAGDSWINAICGVEHVVAVTMEGKLFTWGSNAYGQLGDGTSAGNFTDLSKDKTSPAQIGANLNKEFVKAGAGWLFGLAITSGGELYTWGRNSSGNLGNGTTTDSSIPVLVGTGYKDATCGQIHVTAVKSDGSVWAWGGNGAYQIGEGTTATNRLSPVLLTSLSGKFVQSAFSGSYARNVYAVTTNGQLYGWGLSAAGILGDSTTTNNFRISPVQIASNIWWFRADTEEALSSNNQFGSGIGKQVVTLDRYTVNMSTGGSSEQINASVIPVVLDETVTWTVSKPGIISFTSDNSSVPSSKIVSISALSSGVVRLRATVQGGYYAEAVIYVTGPPTWTETALACAQPNAAYSDGVTASAYPVPTYSIVTGSGSLPSGVNLNTTTGAITGTPTTPGNYTFTIRATNSAGSADQPLTLSVFGWSADNIGIIKQDVLFNGSVTVGGNNVVYSAVGLPPGITIDAATGAITGRATEPGSYRFTITGTACGKSVSKKFFRIVYPNFDLDLYTWGNNNAGQLGNGTTSTTATIYPSQITNPSGLRWVMTAHGKTHSLAITEDGQLYSWGENYYGQLGQGLAMQNSTIKVTRPTRVYVGSPTSPQPVWFWIVNGDYFSLGLTLDGKMYTWGQDGYGQLGDGGTNTDKNIPTLIPAPAGDSWVNAACGYDNVVAVTMEGKLYTWGNNVYGKLGDGTFSTSSVKNDESAPQLIGASLNKVFVKTGAGDAHCLAIASDGSLFTWGVNGSGNLGIGNTTDKYTPTLVGTGYVDASCGYGHVTAVKSDGSLWGWGANGNGQVGDGTKINRLSPVSIGSSINQPIRSLFMGQYADHAFAVTTDGQLYGWGRGGGVLGDSTTRERLTPTRIAPTIWWFRAANHSSISSGLGIQVIFLDKYWFKLATGSSETRIATVSSALPDRTVVWSSSNTAIATVDQNGVVTAVSGGEVRITATVMGKYSVSAKVLVPYTTPEDTPVTFNLFAGNAYPGRLLQISTFKINGTSYNPGTTATISGKGTIVVNSNGSVTFTPVLNYNGSVPEIYYDAIEPNGAFPPVFKISSSTNVVVTPVNDPPVGVTDAKTTQEDLAVSGNVLTNDSDVEGQTLSVTKISIGGIETIINAGTPSTVTLTQGVLVFNSDGSYTFTPASNFSGSVPVITYTLSDGAATGTSTLTITVTPVNDFPVGNSDTATTNEDTPVTVNVLSNDTDVDGDVLQVTQFAINGTTYTAGSTATITGVGKILISSNGAATFTPDLNYDSTVPTVTYTLSDGKGGTSTSTLGITITPVNDPPVAIKDTEDTPALTLVTGDLLTNDSDVDLPAQTLTITSVSIGGTSFSIGQSFTVTDGTLTYGTIQIDADGSYSFTPTINDFNNDYTVPVITYEVSDGAGGTATSTLDLLITQLPDPSLLGDAISSTIEEDQEASGNVIAQGNVRVDPVSLAALPDPVEELYPANPNFILTEFKINGTAYKPGETATISGVGKLKMNADGTYTFTPDKDYFSTQSNPVPVISYTIADSDKDGFDGTLTKTLTITVTPVNDPPVAGDDNIITSEESNIGGNLLSNDRDVEGDVITVTSVTVSGVTTPITTGTPVNITLAGGVLSVSSTGSYTFTPSADFTGTIPVISYSISDNGSPVESATGSISITVTPVNDAPVAVADVVTTDEDEFLLSFNVLDNDSDIDGDILQVTEFSISGITYTAGTTATITGKGTLVISSDGAVTFTPDENYFGSVPVVTYTISDGNGGTATSTLTISVNSINDLPILTADQISTEEEVEVSGQVLSNDRDVEGSTLVITEVTIGSVTTPLTPGTPSEITITEGVLKISSDGSYTFTPATNYFGTVPPISYKVSDGIGTSTGTLAITVVPVNDIPVAADDEVTLDEDGVASGSLLTNDSDVEPGALVVTQFEVDGVAYTPGQTATIDGVGALLINTDGSYTFTPVANYSGSVPPVSYTITDVDGGTANASVAIIITTVNDNPVATDDPVTVSEDNPITGSVLDNDTDVEGSVLSVIRFEVSGQTYNPGDIATITGVGTIEIGSDGSYTFTPADDYDGEVPVVRYTISDGDGGEGTGSLSVTITPVNDIPVAADDTIPVTEDIIASGSVLSNDSDVDGDVLTVTTFEISGVTYQAGELAILEGVGTLVIKSDGQFTFTPDKNYNGDVPVVTYEISDGNGETATALLQFSITPVNDAPVATDDPVTVTEDTPVTGKVLTNDTDVEGSVLSVIRFEVGGQTYNPGDIATITGVGTVVIGSDGSYTFTPATNYDGEVPVVTYTVSDGNGGEDTGSLVVTMTPVNDAPVAADDAVTTNEDTPSTGSVITNDTDVEGSVLTVTQFEIGGTTYTAGQTATITGVGTLVINSNGSYTFTPVVNYNGSVPVATYTISDGNGGTDTATLTFTVTPVNDAPVAVDDPVSVTEDIPVTGSVVANDTDVEGSVLSVVRFEVGGKTYSPGDVATITGVGTIQIKSDGSYSFTPATNYNGEVPVVSYTVSDGNGGEDTGLLTFTITPVNDAPVAEDALTETFQDRSISGSFASLFKDVENDPGTVTRFSVNGTEYQVGTTAEIASLGSVLINSNGTYQFIPAPGFFGTADIFYTICDNATPASCADSKWSVLVKPASTDPDINVTYANTTTKGNVSVNDGLLYEVTYGTPVPGSKPDGSTATLTMNSDGSYVFRGSRPGVYDFSVPVCAAVDQPGKCPVENLKITVLEKTAEVNRPVANTDIAYTKPGKAIIFKTLANDGPGRIGSNLDLTSVKIITAPANGTVTINTTTGDITYQPNAGFRGLDVYSYSVCDDTAPAVCVTAQQEVSVNELAGVNLTQAADDYVSMLEGAGVTGNVLTNDTDPDGNTLSVTAQDLNLPEGKFKLSSDGSYSFEPALGFNGVLNLSYKVCDNGSPQACASATLYLLVKPFEPQPDVSATFVGIPINGSIATNDQVFTGAVYELKQASGNNPPGATITIRPDGTYVFTAEVPGEYEFICLITQQLTGQSGSGRLSEPFRLVLPYRTMADLPFKEVILKITVLDPFASNNPPIANTDVVSTVEAKSVILKTLANDFAGSPGVTLKPSSVTVTKQPVNGSVSINPTSGDITYTPNAGFVGIELFKYQICDSQNPAKCAEADQKVIVLDVDTPNTTLAADDFNFAIGPVPVSGNVRNNDTDPQNQSQLVEPQSLTLDQGTFELKSDGSYTFTANLGFSGQVEIPYTTCDSGTPQACAKATLYILVSPASIDAVNNDFTSSPVNGFTGGVAGNVYIDDLVNGLSLQAVQVTLNLLDNGGITGASIAADGKVNIPAATKAGTYTLTYKICQVQVPAICDQATVIVKVIPPVITAVDDDLSDQVISNELGGRVGNVFTNDLISGVALEPINEKVTVSIIDEGELPGVTIDEEGNITVPADFEPGTYTIVLSICEKLNPENCVESEVTIKIEYTELTVAGALTPNGDGKNDYFHIRGLSAFPKNNLVIFNRWGNKVYEANGYKNDWDGKSTNGLTFSESNRVPSGTYFYILDTGTGKRVSGSFYLAY